MHEIISNKLFVPINDGIDHINIYSKGKTELGQLLSNFAYTPIIHPEYGNFNSIEGFWYWLKTGKIHEELRMLSGIRAKKLGQQFTKVEVSNFNSEIKNMMMLKLEQHPKIFKKLTDSVLPLTHYYYFGLDSSPKITYLPQYKWITDYWEQLRNLK